jgi:DNA-binding beta-propeller fold protein YncE
LFFSSNLNGWISVYALNEQGLPASQKAVNMLGNPTWYGARRDWENNSDRILSTPFTVDYDHRYQRLFVGDAGRLYVFDVAPDRMEDFKAASVIWRSPARDGVGATGAPAVAAAGSLTMGVGLVDAKHQRLFVPEANNHRVLVYDIRPEVFKADSRPIAVLGQKDFTSRTPGIGPDRLAAPGAMAYDEKNDRLFVTDARNFRILVFDGQRITTGASALAVLGQPDFQSREPGDPFDFTKIQPSGRQMAYDPTTDRLFIVTGGAGIVDNRVAVYDVAPTRMKNFPDLLAVIGKPGLGRYDAVIDSVNVMWPGLGPRSVDPVNQLLYVMEGHGGGNRISIFDIHPDRLRTGQAALGVIGHIDDEGKPSLTRRSPNDRANNVHFYPRDTALDAVGHRLFATDQYQERILVFPLDPLNRVLDYRASRVIGQPDLFTGDMRATSARTVRTPFGLAYDDRHQRLFAVDSWGNRVLVFEAHPDRLTNYPEARAVIGQKDFTSFEEGTSDRAIFMDLRRTTGGITPGGPRASGLVYDRAHARLFVSDGGNSRVLVFDAAPERLQNYPRAMAVIGQPDFVSGRRQERVVAVAPGQILQPEGTPTASSFGGQRPGGMTYDEKHDRLFVSDGPNHRVLVFDAHPDRLRNGAAAIAVIGQPDFTSHASGRSESAINGPDGLAYDDANDYLYVSDHENHRVLVFDAHPDRLRNGPRALAVLGQSDFTSQKQHSRVGFGGSGIQYIYDPRGLAFDSANQRLYLASGAATNLMLWDMPRTTREVHIGSQSAVRFQSIGVREPGATEARFDRTGYAAVEPGGALGAVSSFIVSRESFDETKGERSSRLLISQASATVLPATRTAMVYADQRAGHDTLLAIVNSQRQPASLKLILRDAAGRVTREEAREVGVGQQLRLEVSQLGGPAAPGTLTIASSVPVHVWSLGIIKNERGEQLLRSVSVGDDERGQAMSRYAIPGLRDGGGFTSEVTLMNPSRQAIEGRVRYLRSNGESVRSDNFQIPAGGVFLWATDGKAPQPENGFVIVETNPDASPAPIGGGTLYFRRRDAVISAKGLGGAAVYPDQEAQLVWFPVDTVPNVLRHGQIRQFVTIANPDPVKQVDVRFYLYDAFGRRDSNQYEIVVPPQTQKTFDLGQVFDRTRFARSVVKLLTDLPAGIESHQEIVTVREETVMTEISGIHQRQTGAERWILPEFRDRADFATELHLINPRNQTVTGKLTFFTPDGKPMSVTLR